MAKPKAEPTAASKAADVARDQHAAAVEKNEKTPNAANKAALDKAADAMKAAVKVENRERFQKVGSQRVNKALAAIEQCGKLRNPRTYEYTQADFDKALAALDAKLAALKVTLSAPAGAKANEAGFTL